MTILYLFGIYLLLGLFFFFPFIIKGIQAIDSAATKTPFMFKVLILPGTVALWPYLLLKWIKAK